MSVYIVETERNRGVIYNNSLIHSSLLKYEDHNTREMQNSIAQSLAKTSNTDVKQVTYTTPSGQNFSWEEVIAALPNLTLNEDQKAQIEKASKIKAVKHVLGDTNPLSVENPPITEEDYDKIYDAVMESGKLTVTLNGVDYFLECYYRELEDHDTTIEMLIDAQAAFSFAIKDGMGKTFISEPSPLGEDAEYYQWRQKPREVLFDGEEKAQLRSLAIKGDEINLSELMFKSEQDAIEIINDESLGYGPEDAEDFVIVQVKKELVGAPFAKPEVKPASSKTPMP